MRKLWQHQVMAVDASVDRESFILSLDMGTGKTAVALEVVKRRQHKTVLVVMPKNVLVSGVWQRELESSFGSEGLPYSCVPLIDGTAADKAGVMLRAIKVHRPLPITLFILVNYDTVWRMPLKNFILGSKFDCVILDEAHRIKAAGSKVSKFFAQLQRHGVAKQRLALTGTPIPNSPLDVYGLCRFVDPSIFGTNFAAFQGQYAVMNPYNPHQISRFKNLDDLHRKLDSISFRVMAEDVLDLPESVHVVRYAELEEKACTYYKDLRDEFIVSLNDKTLIADNVLVKLLRLQQITGGFLKWDQGEYEQVSSAKLGVLDEVLEDLPTVEIDGKVSKEPVVVFCRFHQEMDAIKKLAKCKGYTVAEESGRVKELARWQSGLCTMLLVQIQSGSEGIDLTRARYAIYYSKAYSLGLYQQSLRRLLRPGQTRTCVYIHLLVRHTVDEDIEMCLDRKMDIITYLMLKYRVKGDA